MTQTSLWQSNQHNNDFAEVCNALYERELRLLAHVEVTDIKRVQGRLKGLSHYIKKTANLMTQVNEQGFFPLVLDVQNATWSAKQASQLPLAGQENKEITAWYTDLLTASKTPLLGLVVPVLVNDHIILDCIDGVDMTNRRIRTNVSGWFSLTAQIKQPKKNSDDIDTRQLLKPNKKVMLAACAGHSWQNEQRNNKVQPIIPSLRELLLSCAINWQNFKQPLAL